MGANVCCTSAVYLHLQRHFPLHYITRLIDFVLTRESEVDLNQESKAVDKCLNPRLQTSGELKKEGVYVIIIKYGSTINVNLSM
ncbi:hypothetical protein GWI33_014799 [Rhynchophorus ferrugineus]|uniref:Uncharacterized protein n=1 Tax=Rhynchophorus ferrugineus TaxID=354439 RepID=A0A834IEG6_RHYFE|nr:hypothetical protein GWI33_014799 [Rhynchophorus ferrugineus]